MLIIFPYVFEVINGKFSFLLISSGAIEQKPSVNKHQIDCKYKVEHKQDNTDRFKHIQVINSLNTR
jgi:hypothetical protein